MSDRYLSRRAVLDAGLAGGIGLVAVLAGCSPGEQQARTDPSAAGSASTPSTAPTETSPEAAGTTLLVFFSRAGENYYDGGRRDLEIGNTKVLAGMIGERIDCETYEIQAADPYPSSYDRTVARNRQEQDDDARPGIANPLPDVSRYATVLIGSPVWGSRAPMIMSTFVEGVDLAGKAVLPFVTYAVSGMSGIDAAYRDALTASDVRAGLAIRGETVAEAGQELDEWLRASALTS